MNSFFRTLIDSIFKNKEQFYGKKLFGAKSLADCFDPIKEVHNETLQFSKRLNSELGDKLFFKYESYENYGHIPFPSFYDRLMYELKTE